jgi:hypothetical protein
MQPRAVVSRGDGWRNSGAAATHRSDRRRGGEASHVSVRERCAAYGHGLQHAGRRRLGRHPSVLQHLCSSRSADKLLAGEESRRCGENKHPWPVVWRKSIFLYQNARRMSRTYIFLKEKAPKVVRVAAPCTTGGERCIHCSSLELERGGGRDRDRVSVSTCLKKKNDSSPFHLHRRCHFHGLDSLILTLMFCT